MMLNQKELAELTGISVASLHRYANQGMPYHKTGRHRPLYVVAEVKRWLAMHAIKSNLSKGKL